MFEPVLTKSDIRKIFPYRANDSHKGDNGRVCIIGGSVDYYGAPIFSALGAVYSGADLVYMFVPESNFDASRSFYPDFIVRKYDGEYLNEKAIDKILELANKCSCVVIGPGLTDKQEVLKALRKLIPHFKVPTLIDADALSVIQDIKLPYNTILTPHRGEVERIINGKLPSSINDQVKILQNLAKILELDIIMKGPTDIIVKKNGEYALNKTGNAGMTVGGSGDILSGFIASLIAQGSTPYEAACIASFCFGIAGDNLQSEKSSCFSATDLALEIPYVVKRLIG